MGHQRLIPLRASVLLALWLVPNLSWATPPMRICSVSLAGDELLALLGVEQRVVCVSTFADDRALSNVVGRFPAEISRRIGKIEPVLGSAPDLVLAAPWNDADFLRVLAKSGITTIVLEEVHDFDGIRHQLLELGTRLGRLEAAREAARRMDETLLAVDRRLATTAERPRVLALSHMIVSGRGTTVDTLIRRAGGQNVAAAAGLNGNVQVSVERVLALDPDVLLLGLDEVATRDALLREQPALGALRAVRDGRVVIMEPRFLTTVTPYLVDGVRALARALHPNLGGNW